MPPKRKAAATKAKKEETSEIDAGAGGDIALEPVQEKKIKMGAKEKPAPKSKGRGGKRAKEEEVAENGEDNEEIPQETETIQEAKEKPAPKSKGRGGKKAKEEEVAENGEDDEDIPEETETIQEPVEKPAPKSKRRAAKKGKPEKVVDEDVEEDDQADDDKEVPSTRGKPKKDNEDKELKSRLPRNAQKKAIVEEDKNDLKRKKAQPTEKVKPTEKKLMNKTSTNYDDMSFECSKKNANGKTSNFKISCWNVDGLRAWLKKDGLTYILKENPDVVCLQETKCNEEKMPDEMKNLEGYEFFWQDSEKDGYAGVALLSKEKPIEVKYGIGKEEHDDEGRCITAEFQHFFVVSVYVPNAGRKLVTLPKRLEWNKAFADYIKKLDDQKPVIICGDMNVAHNEIDLANPKTNKKNAGFTQEERDGMTDFLDEGFVDTFRKFYPDQKDAYTFWTYMSNARAKNVGWRLDYFLVSSRFVDNICDNVIRDQVFGSDHCPIVLFLNV